MREGEEKKDRHRRREGHRVTDRISLGKSC